MGLNAPALEKNPAGSGVEYAFRAECLVDVLDWQVRMSAAGFQLTAVRIENWSPEEDGQLRPDRAVRFSCSAIQEAICDVMRSVEDGHVMLQTLARADHYTGERDYSL